MAEIRTTKPDGTVEEKHLTLEQYQVDVNTGYNMSQTNTKRNWWDKTKSAIIVIGAIFTMFGLFFGGFQYIDNTYAKDNQVIFLNHKVDVKILDDRINKLQDREWALQDKLATLPDGSPDAINIQRQIRQSAAERKRLDAELQIVIGKYKEAEEEIKH